MVLLVGVRQLQILSQCITIGPFDYGRTTGGGIVVTPATVVPRPRPTNMPAPVQCARALTPDEARIAPLLRSAREVSVRGGIVSLTGPAGRLIIRRPSGALSNPRGEVPAPQTPPLLGAWRFVAVNGRTVLEGARMELLLRPHWLEWRSGCVSEVRELRIERGLLVPGASDPFPVCERGRSEAELGLERLFAGRVASRMERNGRLTLQGSGVTAQLEPLTS
jgi:hypothetical protein